MTGAKMREDLNIHNRLTHVACFFASYYSLY